LGLTVPPSGALSEVRASCRQGLTAISAGIDSRGHGRRILRRQARPLPDRCPKLRDRLIVELDHNKRSCRPGVTARLVGADPVATVAGFFWPTNRAR